MTQSPRRQDPEEYRRLLQEKSALATTIDGLNKEMSELKLVISTTVNQQQTVVFLLEALSRIWTLLWS